MVVRRVVLWRFKHANIFRTKLWTQFFFIVVANFSTALLNKIHFLEHATFMGVALLQWMPLIRPLHRFHYAGQLIYLLAGAILQFPLFFMLAFMNRCYYPTYVAAPRICFMTPIVDQQSGAILMKLSAMAVMFVSLVVIFGRWYYSEQSGRKRNAPAAVPQ